MEVLANIRNRTGRAGRATVRSEPQGRPSLLSKAEPWIALVLCVAVSVAWALEQIAHNRPTYAARFAPGWLPLVAAGLAAAGIGISSGRSQWLRLRDALSWSGLLLMVWAASGLVIDLLRVAGRIAPGLMPHEIDWPGLATRTLALAASVVLVHRALARPVAPASDRAGAWYGYAAFALALPYPLFKTCWALGVSFGLRWPGAEGLSGSFALWLPAIPFLLAAVLSLLLASRRRWMPRRLLLTAGWSATAVVAMAGPAACWTFVSVLAVAPTHVIDGSSRWALLRRDRHVDAIHCSRRGTSAGRRSARRCHGRAAGRPSRSAAA